MRARASPCVIEAIVFNTMNRTQRKVVAEVTFEFPTDAESALEILDPYIYKTTLGDTAEKKEFIFPKHLFESAKSRTETFGSNASARHFPKITSGG